MMMKEKGKKMMMKMITAKEVNNDIERERHYVLDKFIKNYLWVKAKD